MSDEQKIDIDAAVAAADAYTGKERDPLDAALYAMAASIETLERRVTAMDDQLARALEQLAFLRAGRNGVDKLKTPTRAKLKARKHAALHPPDIEPVRVATPAAKPRQVETAVERVMRAADPRRK